MKYLYLLESDGFYKIGVSAHVPSRVHELQTGNPHEIKIVAFCKTRNAHYVEGYLHAALSVFNTHREWFRLTDETIQVLKEIYSALEADSYRPDTERPTWIDLAGKLESKR